jgi:nuclear GTP-binding protein
VRDPGIPKGLPFDDKVQKELATYQERRLVQKARRQEARKQQASTKKAQEGSTCSLAETDAMCVDDIPTLVEQDASLEGLAARAIQHQRDYDAVQEEVTEQEASTKGSNLDLSRRAHIKEFKKVVAQSDVILQVLDARDPLSSRDMTTERFIHEVSGTATEKTLILILNKVDLIPKENADAWIKYLNNTYPTFAFSQKRAPSFTAALLQKLKAIASGPTKKILTVGIVGYPNVGKSSLINALRQSATHKAIDTACPVGATPGLTKHMQAVPLPSLDAQTVSSLICRFI